MIANIEVLGMAMLSESGELRLDIEKKMRTELLSVRALSHGA